MNFQIPALNRLPLQEISHKFQAFLPSGGHQELLNRVDTSLLLFDNTLLNTATGAAVELATEENSTFADNLATAAASLCKNSQNKQVLLLLPPTHFAVTPYQLNLTGEKLLRSALELQAHSLIPAYDESLLLAVNARNQEGVALWYNENSANRLFRAFEREGMFLAAIMPRSFALLEEASNPDEEHTLLINDEEGEHVTFIQARGNAIRRMLTGNRADLEQDVFARQWDIEVSQLKGESAKSMRSLADWQGLAICIKPVAEFSFLPAGALAEEKRLGRARASKVGIAVAACLLLLLFTPFISNWMTLRGLQKELARAQELSEEPRRLQASIFDMDEEWGALDEYPDQHVTQTLISLNDIIKSSLTSFSINEGIIDISGTANDPAFLVEQLSEKEDFYNVGQSTNTRDGGQFGIRMNLSGVDFDAYDEKYPVINQGR